MNIACSSCPAKYAVPDEKVRGRKVRITCKRCGAAIIVDGTATALGEPGTPTSERKRQSTILGGLEAPSNSAPGAPVLEPQAALARPAGVVVPKTGGAGGFPAPRAAGAGPRPAAAAAAPPEPPWTVAITEDDHREMNTAQVVEAYAAGTIDNDTFIWRDGMDDWLTPFEIPAIAAALNAKGLGPDAPPPAPAETPSRPQQQSGWREPGRWDGGHPPKASDVTFDDVTVAMEAPKAQALIDAAATAPAAAATSDSDASLGESTVVGDASRFLGDEAPEEPEASPPPPAEQPRARPAPRPAAGVPPPAPSADVTAPATKAAARAAAARRSSPDLFAERNDDDAAAPRSKMPTIPPEPQSSASMTGARNESSVLFSLDQLVGKPKPGAAKKAPVEVEKVDEAALLMGGAPTASAGSPEDEEAPPSVARIGDGTLFGTAATTMAAPDFTAPAAPSAPSHAPLPPSTAPAKPAEKSSAPLWIALAGVTIVGGAAAFFIMKPAPPPPAPEPPPVATPAAPPPVAAPVPAPTEPAAPPPTAPATAAAPTMTATAATATPPTPAAPAPTAASTAPAPLPAPQPGAPAAQPGALPPKPAPKPAETVAPATAEGPPFDREAASAALATAAATAQGECAGQEGTRGSGKVTVTFVNSGRATNALVSGDFAGSALGGCVARVFRSARIPAFSGDSVRVTKGVRIP